MTLALRKDVSATATDEGMVLLDETSGRYWQLNGTAARILRALLDGATPPQVAAALTARHPDLAPERANGDVTTLITTLTEARLVVPS
ncbi:lasso peptide biosynthesis PqqD family chaperone [Streptomyces stramineus]|uniref:lasso peptide biosynthesis PqqD family chaperone n=1 Tax=Streptomyces TaxID=1883 RepID=UPI0031DE7165